MKYFHLFLIEHSFSVFHFRIKAAVSVFVFQQFQLQPRAGSGKIIRKRYQRGMQRIQLVAVDAELQVHFHAVVQVRLIMSGHKIIGVMGDALSYLLLDGQKQICLVIKLIDSLPEHFKIEHLAFILAGKSNAEIRSYKHDELELFGAGEDRGEKFWMTVIHQGLLMHLLGKEIESYGRIFVTEAGREFFENPRELIMVEDRVFSSSSEGGDDDDDDASLAAAALKGGGGADDTLLHMLKDLRKDFSRRLNLQPWIIFQDPALQDMSILYPVTIDELKNCQGVGEGKARKYGAEFIELIKKYVEQNDIIRPDDFVVKSSPSKSKEKIYIINCIDRRMALDDIARACGLDMDELLGKIEAIVSSGLKLDIDYFIEENIDEDAVNEIYEYFKTEAVSDSVSEAMEALGSDYDEMEIRLVRIKFLCEIAS